MSVIEDPDPKLLNSTYPVLQRAGCSAQTVSPSVFNVVYTAQDINTFILHYIVT